MPTWRGCQNFFPQVEKLPKNWKMSQKSPLLVVSTERKLFLWICGQFTAILSEVFCFSSNRTSEKSFRKYFLPRKEQFPEKFRRLVGESLQNFPSKLEEIYGTANSSTNSSKCSSEHLEISLKNNETLPENVGKDL